MPHASSPRLLHIVSRDMLPANEGLGSLDELLKQRRRILRQAPAVGLLRCGGQPSPLRYSGLSHQQHCRRTKKLLVCYFLTSSLRQHASAVVKYSEVWRQQRRKSGGCSS